MALVLPRDRLVSARTRAQRRAIRARVAAVVAVAAAAWWAHATYAGTQSAGRDTAVEGAAVRVAAEVEARPLGATGATRGAGTVAAPGANAAPAAHAAPSAFGDTLRTGAALAVVLGLIGGTWWWLRRSGIAALGRSSVFEVVARHPVGRGQQVVVARFGPRVLCLQQTRDGLRTLCELTEASDISAVLAEARANGGRGDRAVGRAMERASPNAGAVRTVDVRGKVAP